MTSYLKTFVLLVIVAVALISNASGQQLLIDRGLRVNDLWCFPLYTDTQTYVYLAHQSSLSTDDDGNPQFSLLRYSMTQTTDGESAASITAAAGGANLHMLVWYHTPESTIRAAETTLRDLLDNDDIIIRGPVIFEEGRYALVSSIINPDNGSSERHLLAMGQAPVLEGNRIALAFQLDPTESSLLLESLRMATPDVSIVFDMTFAGLTEAYDAELTVDWSEVRSHQAMSAGGSVYWVSADVEQSLDELRRDNAIQLRATGSDAAMEGLLNTVYSKLLELMFKPVKPEQVPADQRGGLMDAISALIDPRTGPLSSGKTTGFGLHAGYQLKEMTSTGVSVMRFNSRSVVKRHHFITFNIGDFHARHGTDTNYFRTEAIDDSTFLQREIFVSVDGALQDEFNSMVNGVTVTLRKEHAGGEQTLKELRVMSNSVDESNGKLFMTYGWKDDTNRIEWLEYMFRTTWEFQGGGQFATDWTAHSASMINLFVPYERRIVSIVGDESRLSSAGVRAVSVRLDYPFFGDTRSEQLVIRPGDLLEPKEIEITLPLNEYEYTYTVTWFFADGNRRETTAIDASGLIFVDDIPSG